MSTQTDITGLLDLHTGREAIIPLEPEDFERTAQLSRLAINETHQWRTYVNGLALRGFGQWLEERATSLVLRSDQSILLRPEYTSVLDAVCHLAVGDFSLCLIVTESVAMEWVTVPRAVVELPEFVAHLYVLLEVQEEPEQVVLRGCLRYDQLRQHQQASRLVPQPDWHYRLPLEWFDPDSSHLLFNLRFLAPATLALPAIAPTPTPTIDTTALAQRLLQMDADADLWDILTWEQGVALLTNPDLLQTLYQHRIGQTPAPVSHPTTTLSQSLMNVWNWSQDRLDVMAQVLSWSLPQPLTPAFAMRRSPAKVESALHDIMHQQGIAIPPAARYACTTLAGTPFDCCAVTWMTAPTGDMSEAAIAEWALLLILVAQPGQVMPLHTTLQIGTMAVPDDQIDGNTVTTQARPNAADSPLPTVLTTVTLETTDLYLYVLVEGTQAEAFTATILSSQTDPIALPVFICQPHHTP